MVIRVTAATCGSLISSYCSATHNKLLFYIISSHYKERLAITALTLHEQAPCSTHEGFSYLPGDIVFSSICISVNVVSACILVYCLVLKLKKKPIKYKN